MPGLEDKGKIITNDPKDAIIARLVERTEWIMEDCKQANRVIERLERTLDQLGDSMAAQTAAIKDLLKRQETVSSMENQIVQLTVRVAQIESPVKFWEGVRDRIALWALGMLVMATAAVFGAEKLFASL